MPTVRLDFLEVFDETVSLTNDTISFNFAGSGVTATQSGGAVTVTIPGGSGVAIGDTITTATQGSILFAGASGVLAQDNSNFFWDNSNDFLGIGTNTPTNTLEVSDSATSPSATRSAIQGTLAVSNALNNNQAYYGGAFQVTKNDNNNGPVGYLIGSVGQRLFQERVLPHFMLESWGMRPQVCLLP